MRPLVLVLVAIVAAARVDAATAASVPDGMFHCAPSCSATDCPDTAVPCGPIYCRDNRGLWRCDEPAQCTSAGCQSVRYVPDCCPPPTDGEVCFDVPPICIGRAFCTREGCFGVCPYPKNTCAAVRSIDPYDFCLPTAHCERGGPFPCAGDCDANGRVNVAEATRMVGIALGAQILATCPIGDANDDQTVSVDELVRAIGSVLGGCQ